jgi:hypothetical protein
MKLLFLVPLISCSLFCMDNKNKISDQERKIVEELFKKYQNPPQPSDANLIIRERPDMFSHQLINPEGTPVAMCFANNSQKPEFPDEAKDEHGNLKDGWKIQTTLLE